MIKEAVILYMLYYVGTRVPIIICLNSDKIDINYRFCHYVFWKIITKTVYFSFLF